MPSIGKHCVLYQVFCQNIGAEFIGNFFSNETRLVLQDISIISYLHVITIQGRIVVVYVNLLIFILHKESYCDHNFHWNVYSQYAVAHFSAAAPKIPRQIVLATYRADAYYFVWSYNNRTMLSSNWRK